MNKLDYMICSTHEQDQKVNNNESSFVEPGGEGGIRTLDTLLTYTP